MLLFLPGMLGSRKKGGEPVREIIEAVVTWSHDNKQSSIPIISYTGFAKGTLDISLKEREHLIDIWDKDSCSQEYVTWRLAKIAIDISRLRPDKFLLRLIQEMPRGAKWHDVVRQMPVSYNVGNTERDQIEGVGQNIVKIGQRLGARECVKEMWQVMSQWENLSRAVSATVSVRVNSQITCGLHGPTISELTQDEHAAPTPPIA